MRKHRLLGDPKTGLELFYDHNDMKKKKIRRSKTVKKFVGHLEYGRVGKKWIGTLNLLIVAGATNIFRELHSLQTIVLFFLHVVMMCIDDTTGLGTPRGLSFSH